MNRSISVIIAGLITATIFGCGGTSGNEVVKPTVSEESLGLRKTTIYTEETTTGDLTTYGSKNPGESQKIDRAFVNAPPMIPHSTEGLLPIERYNNQCLNCHMPEMSQYMDPKPTPIPKTHFTNWRPATSYDGKTFKTEADVMNNKTFSKSLGGVLHNGRFNCTQCHAPQSTGALVVENDFSPDFTNENEKHNSNLLDVLNEGL